MDEKISVIVPIYKVEAYLKKCVDLLLKQTYSDLEIILVDDGSPDACPDICDDYAEKDNRIKVIHKKNGGLSDARNAGMQAATGRYLSFIDSDDFISLDFYEVLLQHMQKEGSDICECEVLKIAPGEEPSVPAEHVSVRSYDTSAAMRMLIEDTVLCQHVWNKLYKRELVEGIFFPKGKLNEDEFWTYRVFGRAKKITKVHKPMYFYLQRPGSIMAESYSLRRLDALEAKFLRQNYIQKHFPQLSAEAKLNFYSSCIFAGQASLKFLNGTEKKQAMARIRKYARGCAPAREEIQTVSDSGYRVWLRLSRISFYVCCKIRSIAGIGF